MSTFFFTLIVIVAVLLVLVVLAQNSKGGGLSSQFGGSGASQIMGVKRTSDFLEKLTWGLAIAMVVLTISSFIALRNESPQEGFSSPNVEEAKSRQESQLPDLSNELPLEVEGASETGDSAAVE